MGKEENYPGNVFKRDKEKRVLTSIYFFVAH
jgi:hypothetical protein